MKFASKSMSSAVCLGIAAGWLVLFALAAAFDLLPKADDATMMALMWVAVMAPVFTLAGGSCRSCKRCAAPADAPADGSLSDRSLSDRTLSDRSAKQAPQHHDQNPYAEDPRD